MPEPLKATFFTLQPRDRAVLLPATGVMLALVAVIVGAFVALNWSFFSQMHGLIAQGMDAEPSQEEGVRAVVGMFGLIGSTLLFLFPLYFVIAAYEAACLRWMIRGEASGIAFDHDMWRVYGVYWCWFLMHFAVGIVVSMLTMPIVFMSMGDLMTAGGEMSEEAFWRWQWQVQIPLILLQYIPMIYLGVRFAPASAVSVARKRFAFFDAWKVTDGRFLELLGTFALLMVVVVAIGLPIMLFAYNMLLDGQLWELIRRWPTSAEDVGATTFENLMPLTGGAILAASYIASIVLWMGYALMSYGVNARTALVALEEGKIQVYTGDD